MVANRASDGGAQVCGGGEQAVDEALVALLGHLDDVRARVRVRVRSRVRARVS